jgi:hypothetical protein
VITALWAVRERLRGQRIRARTNDPGELARAAFMLIDITVAVLLREGQAAGRTEEEARAAAISWLEAQAGHAEIKLLESGAVFNPDGSVLKLLATSRRRPVEPPLPVFHIGMPGKPAAGGMAADTRRCDRPEFEGVLAAAQGGSEAAFSRLWRDATPALLRYLRVIAPQARRMRRLRPGRMWYAGWLYPRL